LAKKEGAGMWLDRLFARFPIARFARFCVVGLSGLAVDMTALYLLSDPRALGWGLTQSKIISSELAIINDFIWNNRWTFGDISRAQGAGIGRWSRRLLKFNAIYLIGMAINVLLLNIFFHIFGMNRYLANLIAIAIVAFWNFLVNLNFNWRLPGAEK